MRQNSTRTVAELIVGGTLLLTAATNPAMAGLVRTFSVSEGVQPDNVGSITLTQNGPNAVDISVDLLDGYGFLNTGGPHTPFAFNLSGSGTLSISPFTTPAGGAYADGTFSLNTSGGSNTPFGSYGVAIDSSAGNGSSNAYFGDLLFTLNRIGGLDTNDFVQNTDGYFFSADLTDGSDTGAQAWASPVPIPAALPLFLTALAGLGFIAMGSGQPRGEHGSAERSEDYRARLSPIGLRNQVIPNSRSRWTEVTSPRAKF